jgi:L-ornithine N5-oxygenase
MSSHQHTSLDSSSTAPKSDRLYDLIGIGFGPANLALSIALRESQESQDLKLRYIFVEKQPNFAWHSSLLLPGAQLQVSPLKDLATMRDPTSSYTFFNYLHQQGRLAAYINRETNIPSRMEWSAYLAWAARRMEEAVEYSQEVIQVEAEQYVDDERIRLLKVTTRDVKSGQLTVRKARNITLGVGGVPRWPAPFQDHSASQKGDSVKQFIHSSTYLPSLAALEPILRQEEVKRLAGRGPFVSSSLLHHDQWAPLRFAVVGSGQSSAEMTLHLRRTFPNSNVKLIFRASALVPSDDSAFVNAAAFDPERTDVFWKANAKDRKAWAKEFRRTNYSVVRSNVLNQINEQLYDQRVEFDQPYPNSDGLTQFGKLELLANTEIFKVERDVEDGHIRLSTTNTHLLDCDEQHTVDAVFLGTGFQRHANAFGFLDPIAHHYPLLDTNREKRIDEMGFTGEEEDNATISKLMQSRDEDAVERLRLRCRGIARDYRLVSYSSDAFTHHRHHHSTSIITDSTTNSGLSSPITLTGSIDSSGTTLASNKHSNNLECNPEASIFFLGGNEETHGLADSLLSIVAHRAGELTESIIAAHTASASIDTRFVNASLSQPRNPASTLNKDTLETLEESVQTMQVN